MTPRLTRSLHMTRQETEAALDGLRKQIARYARLAVTKGAAVQPGQELVIRASVECSDFVRMLAYEGYAAGAGHVTVMWSDIELDRLEYTYMDIDYFKAVDPWTKEQYNTLAANGAAFLMVTASDPHALTGIDPQKPATRMQAHNTQCDVYRKGLDFGHNTWTIVGAPTEAWAKTVFPNCSKYEAVYRLWHAILVASRAMGSDPQVEWERHNAAFEKNKRLLNGYAFDRLHYTSSNGTDLWVGLNRGHVWMGGACRTVNNTVYFPNIPTEEVFTSPDRNRINGVVHSVLPLVYAGNTVEDFWFRFEDGRVVDYDSVKGKDVLQAIIQTDKNACRLGECALVAKNTPIRQSEILYYSTLYDENASCHLALGTGFPECIEGGYSMSKEELVASGVNQSDVHVDFMIGADDLSIIGVTPEGQDVPVFVDGCWAWDVQ